MAEWDNTQVENSGWNSRGHFWNSHLGELAQREGAAWGYCMGSGGVGAAGSDCGGDMIC